MEGVRGSGGTDGEKGVEKEAGRGRVGVRILDCNPHTSHERLLFNVGHDSVSPR